MITENTECLQKIQEIEKINELIDLCIDRELYRELNNILILDHGLKIPTEPKELEETISTPKPFPVIKLTNPTDPKSKYLISFEEHNELEEEIRKVWSHLFWAKRLRALILENNSDRWTYTYEHLLLYLEKFLPQWKGEKAEKDVLTPEYKAYNITLFNCLMELSALDTGAGSYGYADRARKVLGKRLTDTDENRKERGPYDRWIWWNKGTALQHVGDSIQKAVLEFNQVVKTFYRDNIDQARIKLSGSPQQIEFMLNIWPAIMQRASLQLRLQLGYHALITLSLEQYYPDILKDIYEGNGPDIYKQAAKHLIIKTKLMEMEALLQLEDMEEAKNKYDEIIKILPEDEPIKYTQDIDNPLPSPLLSPGLKKSYHTQLIEQIIAYRLQLLQLLQQTQEDKPDAKDFLGNINKEFDTYWRWVKNNSFDKRVYLTRHAQALKEIARIFKREKKSPKGHGLIESIDEFYRSFHQRVCNEEEREDKYGFNKYRSDDLPDIRDGFKSFCENMHNLYEDDGKDRLKQDYWNFIAALDKNEEEFGENLRIGRLKRCNDRLIFFDDQCAQEVCKKCFEESNKEPFQGLLPCCKEPEDGARDKCPAEIQSKPCETIKNLIKNLIKADAKKRDRLSDSDYEYLMASAEEHLIRHLGSPSTHRPINKAKAKAKAKAIHFHGLRRWNSLTPAQGRSVGGGYLLYETDDKGAVSLGIAIDPGFDYVRNLFKMGFSLKDIDVILISHAHLDHLWDFESIVQLLHELDDKGKGLHRVNVILTLASYRNLEHIIRQPTLRRYINTLVIDIEKELHPDDKIEFSFVYTDNKKSPLRWKPILKPPKNSQVINIRCTRAYHDDISDRSDSYGFIIELPVSSGENQTLKFGYTGDTKWVSSDLYGEGCPLYAEGRCEARLNTDKDEKKKCEGWKSVAEQYKDCDVLLLHLGSLIDHKKGKKFYNYKEPEDCEKLIREKNHSYLMGMIRFLSAICKQEGQEKEIEAKPSLILLGEFGEELRGGIRTDIVERFKEAITKEKPILPVDVGLDILLWEAENEKNGASAVKAKFLCSLCDEYRPIDNVDYIRYGQDEAIFYVCKTCKKSFPQDVQQNKLRQLYEIGRELKTQDEKSNAE